MTGSVLQTTSVPISDAVLITAHGTLDSRSYMSLRDTIIKAALDHPAAVIVEMTDLSVPAVSALAVFTSAHWHINRYPEVPLLLVCQHAEGRKSLGRNAVARYIPVFSTVDEAVDTVNSQPADSRHRIANRLRARAELPADSSSAPLARELVSQWLKEWSQTELLPIAKVVVTVFVENALRYTDGPISLRVESRDDQVTIAVEDNSRLPAEFQEGPIRAQQLTSLKIVDVLCKSWGCNPIPTGKAVWGVVASEKPLLTTEAERAEGR